MKTIYHLQIPDPDPFLVDPDSPLIVWFAFPNGRRTVSMALIRLIEFYYWKS